MGKIYARQVVPEYQKSDVFSDNVYSTNVVNVWGNPQLYNHISDVFRDIVDVLDNQDLADALDDIALSGYRDEADAVNDYIPPQCGHYSASDIEELCKHVRAYVRYGAYDKRGKNAICSVLSIVTDKLWDWAEIRGCNQGDWTYVFYRMDCFTRADISTFEALYFNEGSEWIIHNDSAAPDTPADISGYSVYCINCRQEDICAEIADVADCAPSDVVLYAFDGWERSPKYKKI